MPISDADLWHQVHAQREDGITAMFLIRDIEPRADQPEIFVIQLPYTVTDLSRLPDAAGYRKLDAFQEQWVEPACEALGWTFVAWKSEDGSFFLYLYGDGDPNTLLEKLSPFDAALGFFHDRDADWSEYAALRELVEQAEQAPDDDEADGHDHVHGPDCDHEHEHDHEHGDHEHGDHDHDDHAHHRDHEYNHHDHAQDASAREVSNDNGVRPRRSARAETIGARPSTIRSRPGSTNGDARRDDDDDDDDADHDDVVASALATYADEAPDRAATRNRSVRRAATEGKTAVAKTPVVRAASRAKKSATKAAAKKPTTAARKPALKAAAKKPAAKKPPIKAAAKKPAARQPATAARKPASRTAAKSATGARRAARR